MTINYDHILEAFDEPGQWEEPGGFQYADAARRFEAFVSAFRVRTDEPFTTESGTQIQDASFYSAIQFPEGWLRFSKFGRMIAFTPDYSVSTEVVTIIEELAQEQGLVLVPTDILERDYPRSNLAPSISTWWIRYFDYL